MPAEIAPATEIETAGTDEANAPVADELVNVAPTADLLRQAILERPWAIKPATLRLMASGHLPVPAAPRPVAAMSSGSYLERAGGYMTGPVAVIPMYGVISNRSSFWSWLFGGASIDGLRAALRESLADPAVASVVFDIDSPGGSTDGVTEFAAELRTARAAGKPIVGQVNTLCASAALWLAANMSEIAMTPSGEAGSIGVYSMHEDDSGLLEQAGIKITLISAGPYKTEGNPFEPLSDDGRAAIQSQVDALYGMFLADVAKGRGISSSAVASGFGQGRTFMAAQALAAGMVDRVATLDETVRRLQPAATRRRTPASASPTPLIAATAAASVTPARPDWAWINRMKGIVR